MPEQSYEKHAQFVPLYHFILGPLIIATFIGSLVNVYHSIGDHERIYNASLISALALAMMLVFLFARVFALGAQDRVIRAEENMRHYLLTGRPLDGRTTVKQCIALRFASDQEFPQLARQAAETGMSPADIKKAVKSWRA